MNIKIERTKLTNFKDEFQNSIKKSLDVMKDEFEFDVFQMKVGDHPVWEAVPAWKKEPYLKVKKQNFKTGHVYRGYNIPTLYRFKDEFFLTKNQVEKQYAGTIVDDNPAVVVVWIPYTKKKGETDAQFFARTKNWKGGFKYWEVYGVSQCSGIPEHEKLDGEHDIQKVENVEEFVAKYIRKTGCSVTELPDPNADIIMPPITRFDSHSKYYFHLFSHMIFFHGKKEKIFKDGDAFEDFSMPHLVTEIGAAALCHVFGIEVPKDSKEYAYNWIQKMEEDLNILPGATKRAEQIIKSMV